MGLRPAVRRLALLLVVSLIAAAGSTGIASAAPTPGVAWKISLVAEPTNLNGAGTQYVLVLTNTGGAPSSGTITLTDSLPAGVTNGGSLTFSTEGWECTAGSAGTVLTCTYGGVVAGLGQTTVLTLPVTVGATGTLVDHVQVAGGGAPVATASLSTEATSSSPSFGILDFGSQTSELSGAPDTRAGDHPYALTTTLDFSYQVQKPHDVEIDLPPGLIGNPQAAPQCAIVQLFARSCPANTQVGTILVNMAQGLFERFSAFPIYNIVPEHGYPAEFGLFAEGVNRPVLMYASVGAAPIYQVHISVPDIPAVAKASDAIVVFFGDPEGRDGTGNPTVPFFTNPSDCSGAPLTTSVEADTWEEPNSWMHGTAEALPVAGCNLLQFQPTFSFTPENTRADEPAEYTFDLHVPQSQSTGLEGLATPPVKDVTVRLPAGVSVNPAAADGLAGCRAVGPEGINIEGPESEAPNTNGILTSVAGHCPQASQIATLEAERRCCPHTRSRAGRTSRSRSAARKANPSAHRPARPTANCSGSTWK